MLGGVMPAIEPRLTDSRPARRGAENQRARRGGAVNFLPRITCARADAERALSGDFYFPVETAQRPFFSLWGRRRNPSDW